MTPTKGNKSMMIFYACDGENPATMPLETLINNFNLSNAWKDFGLHRTCPAVRTGTPWLVRELP